MRLGQAVLRSIALQNATLLISFGSGLVIARLVTPAEFGAYSVALAVLSVAITLRDFGVGSYAISSSSLEPDLLRSAFGLGLASAAIAAAVLFAASWFLAELFGNATLGQVLRIAAPAGLVTAAVLPATILLTRGLRFDALLIVGLAGAATQALVSIMLAWAGLGAVGLGWGFLAGACVTALVTLAFRPEGAAVGPSARGWGGLVGFSGLLSATLVVGTVAQQTPQLMIGRMMGLAEAALFARAQNIVSVILNSFFFAIMKPMLPGLAQAERESGDMAPLYLQVVACVTALSWPAYAFLVVWAEPLVRVLYGPAWSAAGQMILPLAVTHGLLLSVAPHYDAFIIRRRVALLLLSETSILAVTATALLAAIWLGASQPLWALTLGAAFFAGWYFVALRAIIGFRPAELAAAWVRSLALALAVLPAPLLVRHLVAPASDLAILACVALSGLVAGIAWLGVLRASRHPLWAHLAPVLARLRTGIPLPPRAAARRSAS